MQFFSKLTSFFITIGLNTERRKINIDYGNILMIVYYYIQLIGYIYSQFETKEIKYYENDFLAQVFQLSSIPFIFAVIQYDPLTKCVYYIIFIIMCLIFITCLFQILVKQLPANSPINKFTKFYFQNFQWFFLTPFNECMVGVITCERQSYLAQHSTIQPLDCFSVISPHYLIISFTGIIMVSLSGIISMFCFRNYEFLQRGLLRKFSKLNYVTIFSHQLLILLSFWKLMMSNHYIIIHSCYHFIMFIIFIDIVTKVPFGFTYETIYYARFLIISTLFGILISLWIFTEWDDGIIFLNCSLITPLFFMSISVIFSNYFEKETFNFCLFKNFTLNEYPLEYLVLLSTPQSMTKINYFMFLKCLSTHCKNCKDLICPCNKDISSFIQQYGSIDYDNFYIWVQYQFQKLIKISMNKRYSIESFEQLTIKYSTFLQKYRENQYLSYKSIQDIVLNFNRLQKNNYQYPEFFLGLTKKIQSDNKKELELRNRSTYTITKTEFKTVNDLNLFIFYENDLMVNIQQQVNNCKDFWLQFQNGTLKDFNSLLYQSNKLQTQIKKVEQAYKKFLKKREDPLFENILTLRIRLLLSIVCLDDLDTQLKLADKLQTVQKESLFLSKQQFHVLKYINREAISVASLISFESFGQIDSKFSSNFKSFFGYDDNDQLYQIEQLLPTQIGQIHNGLIEKFLMIGQSSKIYHSQDSFIKNKANFIENITMCLTTQLPIYADVYQFQIISHLLKQNSTDKKNQENQEIGYLLVDVHFCVFGISENIFKKITQYSQGEIQNLDQIQQKLTLFQLIPELFDKLTEYYKLKQLQNKNIANQEIIFFKHGGTFQVPYKNSINYNDEDKIKNNSNLLTNKVILNNLAETEKKINFLSANQIQFPIEYSVTQNVLNPQYNGIMSDFLYYKIEIQFQDDSYNNKSSFQILPSFQDFRKDQQITTQHRNSNQSQIIYNSFESNSSENFIHKQSQNATELKSENDLYYQLTQMNKMLSHKYIPKSILSLTLIFALQFLILLMLIIGIVILYSQKSTLQSNCVKINTIDLDFLDAYSQIMSGSRHMIYFRDFYQNISDQIIRIDKKELEFSSYNKLVISWNHINLGVTRLLEIYKKHKQIFSQSSDEDLNIYIINSDLKSKIIQQVRDQSTYYQVMFQIFFMSKQMFTQNLSNFLQNSTDPYTTQISRSLVYYNYFDVNELVKQKLEDCKSYNNYINEYIDNITLYFFIGLYITNQFIAIIQFIFYFKIKRQISFYLKLFVEFDIQDSNKCLQNFENINTVLNIHSIILSKKNYERIIVQPSHQYDYIRGLNFKNQINFTKKSKLKDKQIRIDNHISYFQHILALIIISLIPILFALAFQLYYNLIAVNLIPINEQAIEAQEIRLKFITTINRYDQFLIKSYFQSYCLLSQLNSSLEYQCKSNNIYSDNQILQLLDMNEQIIQKELSAFQYLDFSNFFFNSINSNQFSSTEKQSILSRDTCLLTNCDMKNDLFQDRLFQDSLNVYFFQGIIKLHQIVSSLYVQFDFIYKELDTNEQKLIAIRNIMQDNDYLIYILWGLDAIQYQIAQFSQYFVNTSLTILEETIQKSQIIIFLTGILALMTILLIQNLIIQKQQQRFMLSKFLIKLIPLQVIVNKRIHLELAYFQKKINN